MLSRECEILLTNSYILNEVENRVIALSKKKRQKKKKKLLGKEVSDENATTWSTFLSSTIVPLCFFNLNKRFDN